SSLPSDAGAHATLSRLPKRFLIVRDIDARLCSSRRVSHHRLRVQRAPVSGFWPADVLTLPLRQPFENTSCLPPTVTRRQPAQENVQSGHDLSPPRPFCRGMMGGVDIIDTIYLLIRYITFRNAR